MSTRRHFIKTVSMAGAGAYLLRGKLWASQSSPVLTKFAQKLPGVAAPNELGNYIPVAIANKKAISGVDYYQLEARQYQRVVHPALRDYPTTFWGYADVNGSGQQQYLGPAIVAKGGTPVQMTVRNTLPNSHPLPVDTTLPGAEPGQPVNRIAVHLHGGYVPWVSDGGPMSWFDPNGNHGMSFMNNIIPNAKIGSGLAEYYYPNEQTARLMWYHDHAMGLTRLNAYAGLAAPYIVTDGFEAKLASVGLLPPVLGSRDIPLVIQDKGFNSDGSLFYPDTYDAEQGDNYDPPFPSCVPEAFFDTILINGAVYPYVQVEPRIYRFRVLNGSQARFYNLRLQVAQPGGLQADQGKPGPAILQIGTEGGFLPAPVLFDKNTPFVLNADGTFTYNLLLAPAERADILVDFTGFEGATLILYNDANAPFPGGDPAEENTTANPDTRNLLQFKVAAAATGKDPLPFTQVISGLTKFFAGSAPAPLKVNRKSLRTLTLNEDFDDRGRLIQMLGTTAQTGITADGLPYYGKAYMDPATEVVHSGSTEIWRIFNLTGDTHPVHFHLVNVQVLGRAPFYALDAIGKWTPPDPNERGWKETVRMNPGEVTDIIANFTLPSVPFKVPVSPMGGHEYVWHCHILEHEEHDMMRPLIVK